MSDKKEVKEKSNFVSIGASLGGILLTIIILILIFAKEILPKVIIPLVTGFVIMAIVLGILQYKSDKNSINKKR